VVNTALRFLARRISAAKRFANLTADLGVLNFLVAENFSTPLLNS
jgi:hypothetical protein